MVKSIILRTLLIFCVCTNFISAKAQNSSLNFNGTSQYVDCGSGSLLNATAIKTLECWVKLNSTIGTQEILSRSVSNSGIDLLVSGGLLSFYCAKDAFNISGVIYSSSLSTNTWYHVAATWDGSTKESMVLYVNGKSVGSRMDVGNINGGITNPTSTFRIGQWSQAVTSRFLNGTVDEVRVWSVQRTPAQIKAGIYGAVPSSTANLIAYYGCNEGSGASLLTSTATSGISGTLMNSPSWVASPVQYASNALNFDGSNDQVIAPANSAYDLTSGTIECWAMVSSFPAGVQQHLVGVRSNIGSRYSFHIASNQLGMWNGTSYLTIARAFNTNQWYHLAFVCNGSSTTFYVDGASIGSVAQGFGSMTGLTLVMGISKNVLAADNEPFNGNLDEVRIWNTQRTQTQIQTYKNVTLAGSETGLVALYSFDQGIAGGSTAGLTIAIDGTANNNHAVLTNFALTGATSNWGTHTLTPLPVLFGYFTATKVNSTAMLNWQTTQEQNSRVFRIQRSNDNASFTTIGELPAAGNSSNPREYSFTDPSPLAGSNYYRLLETDLDDKSLYSTIAVLNFSGDNTLRIFPNPAHGAVNYFVNSREDLNAIVTVTDLSGRQLIHRPANLQKGTNHFSVEIGQLSAGYYVLQVRNTHAGLNVSQEFKVVK